MSVEYSDTPFRHWIIDNFLPTQMAQDAADHFFEGEGEWINRHHLYSRHKKTRTQGLSAEVEAALQALEGEGMRTYLEQLTGVKGLSRDADRFGGGQHVTYKGGSLGIHADFTHHPTSGKRRALNLLLYLYNKERRGGGDLELWSADMQKCVETVEIRFNRAVIFETSVTSFHGHPEPLRWDVPRLSLAVYYYVTDCSCGNPEFHHQYPGIVHDQVAPSGGYLKTTDYRPRPWEYGLRMRRWMSKLVKG